MIDVTAAPSAGRARFHCLGSQRPSFALAINHTVEEGLAGERDHVRSTAASREPPLLSRQAVSLVVRESTDQPGTLVGFPLVGWTEPVPT